jgi:hypothetical protein
MPSRSARRRIVHAFAVLVAGASALTLRTAEAQETRRLIRDPGAGERFAAVVVDSIADRDLPFSFRQWSTVLRDGAGGWYVSGSYEPGRIFHLGAEGEVRGFGRVGEGPGEFSEVPERLVRMPDGSLGIVDRVRQRFSVVTGDLSALLFTTRLPGEAFWAWPAGADALVVQSWIRPPERVGHPLHLVSGGGEILRSFGDGPGYGGVRAPFPPFRAAVLGHGGIVVADRWRYRLQRFDREGLAMGVLTGDTEWIPRLPPEELVRNAGFPAASIYDLWADGTQLWVAIWVRNDGRPLPPETPVAELGDFSGHYSTVVELVDLDEGRILGTRRFAAVLGNFVGPGEIVRPVEAEDGTFRMRVLRLEGGR